MIVEFLRPFLVKGKKFEDFSGILQVLFSEKSFAKSVFDHWSMMVCKIKEPKKSDEIHWKDIKLEELSLAELTTIVQTGTSSLPNFFRTLIDTIHPLRRTGWPSRTTFTP
jgi:hypothetical protein